MYACLCISPCVCMCVTRYKTAINGWILDFKMSIQSPYRNPYRGGGRGGGRPPAGPEGPTSSPQEWEMRAAVGHPNLLVSLNIPKYSQIFVYVSRYFISLNIHKCWQICMIFSNNLNFLALLCDVLIVLKFINVLLQMDY